MPQSKSPIGERAIIFSRMEEKQKPKQEGKP